MSAETPQNTDPRGLKRGRGVNQATSPLWFEDGNIVLAVQDTSFRVHRGVLSRNSEVFRDMFSLAQPTGPQQSHTSSGCPIVPLSDNKEEVSYMLQALYDGQQYGVIILFFLTASRVKY